MIHTNLKVGPLKYGQGGTIGIGFYVGGAIALVIESDRGIEAKATVNIPGVILPEGHIILKDWSENEGIPEALIKAGLVELTGESVATGFVNAPIAKMKEPLLQAISKAKGEVQ